MIYSATKPNVYTIRSVKLNHFTHFRVNYIIRMALKTATLPKISSKIAHLPTRFCSSLSREDNYHIFQYLFRPYVRPLKMKSYTHIHTPIQCRIENYFHLDTDRLKLFFFTNNQSPAAATARRRPTTNDVANFYF